MHCVIVNRMLDPRKIQAVGFDVDGTLYHIPEAMSIEVSTTVTERAAQLLGRTKDDFEEEYLEIREKLRSNTMTLQHFGLDGEEIFQRVIDDFPLDKYIKKDQKLADMITFLKKKYKLFIITNGPERQVDRKLKLIGLTKADFDPRIYAYDHHWAKPEPAPFLAALEGLKLSAESVAYVGDREDIDIQGAQAVGMKGIYIRGENSVADMWVESVYDLAERL